MNLYIIYNILFNIFFLIFVEFFSYFWELFHNKYVSFILNRSDPIWKSSPTVGWRWPLDPVKGPALVSAFVAHRLCQWPFYYRLARLRLQPQGWRIPLSSLLSPDMHGPHVSHTNSNEFLIQKFTKNDQFFSRNPKWVLSIDCWRSEI